MSYFSANEVFWSSPRALGGLFVLGLLFIHRLGVVAYRLFFSPLAGFPGPKLAAASNLYEQYFNFIKTGSYVFKVAELHDIYGLSSKEIFESNHLQQS
jgi:hypothetical protein